MKKIASWCALALAVLLYVAMPALTGNASTSRISAPQSGIQAEVLGVYFTPPTGAANAIVQTIDASQREVLVQAYGFTHNAIAQSLVRAHQRGVKIRVLLDKKSEKN
jgi:phosphatidylserine/phosphatidylglycerophosphate/cardiolipin synthase-like enzyme